MTTVYVRQLTPESGSYNERFKPYLNVDPVDGAVNVWTNYHRNTTYLYTENKENSTVLGMIIFQNKEYAEEWLEKNKEWYKVIMEFKREYNEK
jgi:hypothetical protein